MQQRILLSLLLVATLALRLDAQQSQGDGAYFNLRFNGRSSEVVKLLEKQPGRGARNTIFLISPMTCPRCEGLAYELMNRIEHEPAHGAKLCVVSYPRLTSVLEYVKMRQFPTRTVLDTSGDLFRELGLDQAPPFITVWDSTGTLLFAKALYGVNADDSTLWENIHNGKVSEPVTPARRVAESVGMGATPPEWMAPARSFRTVLQEDSTSLLAAIGFPSANLSRNILSVMDHLTLTTKMYNLKSGKHLRNLTPDYSLRKMFSDDLGRTEFLNLERRGVAHTMFFGSYYSGDTIFVSATLPEFREQYVTHPDGRSGLELGYYNVAAIVGYSITTGERLSVTRLDAASDSILVASHTTVTPFYNRRRGEVVLLAGKGYPYVGTSTATAIGYGNPTHHEFYDDAPLFMAFGAKDGKYVRRIGALDTINRSLGIGYAIASPRIAADGDTYYMAQNPSSEVMASNGKNIHLKSYFNPNITARAAWHDSLPSVDEIAYLADSCGARITQLAAAKGNLYVLWHIKRSDIPFSKGYYVVLQQYSTSTGKLRREWNIPQTTADGKLSDLGIDPVAGVAVGVYQTSMFSTAVGYRVK